MSNTDTIILILLLFFAWRGWKKGLFRSLIEPISFCISLVIAIIHFDLTGNIAKSFLMVTSGTLLLTFIAHMGLIFANLSTDKKFRGQTIGPSRLLGCGINTVWRGTLVLLLLMVIYMLPLRLAAIQKVQDNIGHSVAFSLTNQYLISSNTILRNVVAMFAAAKDPTKIQKMSSSKEFQDFFLNKKVKTLFEDPEILDLIEEKNILGLTQNKKIQEIFNDEGLMKKLTKVGGKIYEETATTETPEEEL